MLWKDRDSLFQNLSFQHMCSFFAQQLLEVFIDFCLNNYLRKRCCSFTPFLLSCNEDFETPLGFLPQVLLQNFPFQLLSSYRGKKNVSCIPHNDTLNGDRDFRSWTVDLLQCLWCLSCIHSSRYVLKIIVTQLKIWPVFSFEIFQ